MRMTCNIWYYLLSKNFKGKRIKSLKDMFAYCKQFKCYRYILKDSTIDCWKGWN